MNENTKTRFEAKLTTPSISNCPIIRLYNSLQASRTRKLSQCRKLYFENWKSKNCRVKQSYCPISL